MHITTYISLLWVFFAYLVGSITFALISSKLFSLPDPRTYGSGNIGATNVLRSGNRLAALVTLLGDVAKGGLMVWMTMWLTEKYDLAQMTIYAVAIAVVCGHIYPIFSRFAGGKGVATSAGVLLALSPIVGLAALVAWLLAFALSRTSSLSALIAIGMVIASALFFDGWSQKTGSIIIIASIVLLRHRSNIHRLLASKEKQIPL